MLALRLTSWFWALHHCKFQLHLESLATTVFHLFNVCHLGIWLTLVIQVRFDDTNSYFRRIVVYSYILLAAILAILGAAEAFFIFWSTPFVFHMVTDLFFSVMYVFVAFKLLSTLKLFSMSHYLQSRGWIIYISTVLCVSFFARFGIQLYAHSLRGKADLISITTTKIAIYAVLLLITEALPVASLVSFLYLHKQQHKRSILVPHKGPLTPSQLAKLVESEEASEYYSSGSDSLIRHH